MYRVFWLALALSVAACGPTPTTTPASPTATPSPPPSPTPLGPQVTLTPAPPRALSVWVPSNFSINGVVSPALHRALSTALGAQADLTYTVRLKPADGPASLINTLLSAYNVAPDILPDLVLLSQADLARAAHARVVWPLDGRVTTTLSGHYPFAQEMVRFENQQFAVPAAAETWLLAYNTRQYNSAPLTWSEVTTGTLAVAGDEALFWMTLHNYVALGGTLATQTGQPALNSEVLAQALAPLNALHAAERLYAPALTTNSPQVAAQALRDGRATLALLPASEYLAQAVRVNMVADVLPTPAGQPTILISGWGWAVVNRGDMLHPHTLATLEALTMPEALASWTQEARLFPTRPDVLSTWGVSPSAALAARVLGSAQLFPITARTEAVVQAVRQAAREVALGNTLPAQAAQTAAQNTLNP